MDTTQKKYKLAYPSAYRFFRCYCVADSRAVGVGALIGYITYYFRRREHRAHRKTSRRTSNDDGYGGHSERTAKVNSYGVCFGCFLLVKTEYHCRSPPFQLEFTKILIERTKGNEKNKIKR